jgi:hypothetical protein
MTATGDRDRAVTRADLEAKLGEIRTVTDRAAGTAGRAGRRVGTAAGGAAVLLAFLFGRRRGRKRRTFVEIKRI